MRQPTTTARALGAALTALGAFAALPVLAQDATPAPGASATPPGPAQQPAPPPGTVQPGPTQAAPATPTAPGAPVAPAATPPPNYGIQYNGLIDAYYLYAFSNPKFNNGQSNNLGTPYPAIRQNAPTIGLAEVNVLMNPRPNNFGFKATLIAGDDADLNHFGSLTPGTSPSTPGTGESRFKNIQQLYVTYALGADGSGIDFGKFYTPFGYEVTEANGDYNETRSLPYLIVPTYHTGFRLYAANALGAKGLTATAYLVNALYNSSTAGVQDDNKQPAYIGQLNYTAPSGKFTIISELGLAKDKFGGDTNVNSRDTVNDNNFTYNFTSTVLAGLDYTYVRLEPNGGNKVTENGYGVYFRQQFTPKQAYALRVSGYDAHVNNVSAPDFRPYEITATYEYKAAANFTTRLEYRHDNDNTKGAQTFDPSDTTGATTKSNQDTVIVAGLFTF